MERLVFLVLGATGSGTLTGSSPLSESGDQNTIIISLDGSETNSETREGPINSIQDEAVPLFEDPDDYVRTNASAALTHTTGEFPAKVVPKTEAFNVLLNDAHPLARSIAYGASGCLDVQPAKSKLDGLANTDNKEAVRTRVMWAINQIEWQAWGLSEPR